MEQYNQKKLKKLNMPVAKIQAIHNCEEAKIGSQQMANGLIDVLYLSIGSRVMLKSNLWIDKGLVNGALGYIRKIVYQPEEHPSFNTPDVLMIEFDNFFGPTIQNLVPITQITKHWISKSHNCTRKQFPIELTWAITIHKSQGSTLDKAVINIGDKETSLGLTYVALSRVRSLNDILFQISYNFRRFESLKNSKLLKERLQEEERMLN